MNIIKPAVEFWQQDADWIHHVAKCARICYASDGNKDEKLIDNLLKLGHLSMFRHRSIYYIMPQDHSTLAIVDKLAYCPYVEYRIGNESVYLAVNGHFYLEHKNDILKNIEHNIVTAEEFDKWELGYQLMRYTFKVTTQISTSRELNRVSPNNIAEQSTRYVYENGTICKPHWISDEEADMFNENNDADLDEAMNVYLRGCKKDFEDYKLLIDKHKLNRQDARGKLPIDTATICAYTYSISQWRDIIDLRYYGRTGAPHPNAKIVAGMIRKELIKLGYKFK